MNSAVESTILIPTYERPTYLAKSLIWNKQTFNTSKVRFIVLDGSIKNGPQNRQICENNQIEYFHYKNDVTNAERLLAGLNLVRTEIVSFLADDDLINPAGYYQCIGFLKSHPDYSAAHGEYIDFIIKGHKIKYTYGYNMFSIEQSLPLNRLFKYLTCYQPIFYAVFRTAALQTAFKEVSINVQNDDSSFYELLAGCIPVAIGKVKKVNYFYYGRQIGESTPRKYIPDPKYPFLESFSQRYTKVKHSIIKNIGRQEGISEKLNDAIDACFAGYFSFHGMTRTKVQLYYNSLLLPKEKDPIITGLYNIVTRFLTRIVPFLSRIIFKYRKKCNLVQRRQIVKCLKIYNSI